MAVCDILPRVAALEAAVAVASRPRVLQQGSGRASPAHGPVAPEQQVPGGTAPVSPSELGAGAGCGWCPQPRRDCAGHAEADTTRSSLVSKGSGAFPALPASLSEMSVSRRASQDRSGSPLRGSLQQGALWPGTARSSSPSRLLSSSALAQQQWQGVLVQKVEGIISSVHQTLGALEVKSQPAEPARRPGQAQWFPMVARLSSSPLSGAQSPAPSAPAATESGGTPALLTGEGQCPVQPSPALLGAPGVPAAASPGQNSLKRPPPCVQLGVHPGAAELTTSAGRDILATVSPGHSSPKGPPPRVQLGANPGAAELIRSAERVIPSAVSPGHISPRGAPPRVQLGAHPGVAELPASAERLIQRDAMSDTVMSRSSAPAAPRGAWGRSPRSSQAPPHSSSYGSPAAIGRGHPQSATVRL